jgi:peroxiredoxin
MSSRFASWAILLGTGAAFVLALIFLPPDVLLPKPSPVTPTAEEAGIEPGRIAPDFSLPSLNLEAITLSDYRGYNVLLNFFTSWCEPCRAEMPGVQRQFEKHEQHGWVVIGVSIQEPTSDVVAFRDEFGLTFPIALDLTGRIAHDYRIQGTPTNITLDVTGRIVDRRMGYMSELEMEGMIDAVTAGE